MFPIRPLINVSYKASYMFPIRPPTCFLWGLSYMFPIRPHVCFLYISYKKWDKKCVKFYICSAYKTYTTLLYEIYMFFLHVSFKFVPYGQPLGSVQRCMVGVIMTMQRFSLSSVRCFILPTNRFCDTNICVCSQCILFTRLPHANDHIFLFVMLILSSSLGAIQKLRHAKGGSVEMWPPLTLWQGGGVSRSVT